MSEIFFIGFAIFAFLAQILVIALLIWGIAAWRQRAKRTAADGDGEQIRAGARRLYFYVVSFASLMMWVNGAALVGQFVLDAVFGGDVAISSDTGLAAGASILVVGLPLWAFHWRYVQRAAGDAAGNAAAERGSLIRKVYLYAALAVSAAVASFVAVMMLRWALGAEDFDGYYIAGLLAWAPAWAYHWRVEERERQGQAPDAADALAIRRLYVYAASLAGLAALAIGAGRIAYLLLLEGYNALAGVALLAGDAGLWSDEMREMACVALVGGGVWGLHWLWMARGDYGSELRQVYLYMFAIFGGAATALSALGVMLRQTLVWIFGAATGVADPGDFDFLPGAIAGVSVGAALWAYHRDRARREAIAHYGASSGQARSSQRVYDYILAGIGTAALAVAIFTLVNTLLKLAAATAGDVIVGGDLWRAPIATAIALTALGAPIWGYYWRKIQRRALAAGGDERVSVARRIFIFAALGAGALSLLGSVSALLYALIRDALELAISASTLADAAAPVGVIAAAAAFLPYYWAAYARDRADMPDDAIDADADVVADDAIADATSGDAVPDAMPATPRKEVALLAGGDAEGLARELEAALGYRVETLRWADADADTPTLSDEALALAARRVAEAAGKRVLLLPDGEGLRALSYDDD